MEKPNQTFPFKISFWCPAQSDAFCCTDTDQYPWFQSIQNTQDVWQNKCRISKWKNQTKLFPLKSVSDVLLSLMQSVVLFVGKYCFQYLHWFWFHLVSETEENIWGRMDLQAWRINGENLFWSIQVFEWCFYILSQNSCGMSVCVAFLFLHFVRIGSSQELFHSLPDSLYQVGIFVED